MKPSKLLTGLLLGAMMAPAALASAAGPGAGVAWLLAASSVGQTRPRATTADRLEAEKLLVKAREAMKQGDLKLADSFISRAEAMRVDFGVFHLGDTPKKARHDLELRRRAARPEASPPSARFKPSAAPSDETRDTDTIKMRDNSAEGSEPNLGRANTPSPRPPVDDGASLPGIGRSDTSVGQSPFARRLDVGPPAEGSVEADIRETPAKLNAVASADPDARRRSDALVLAARRAIAQNDLRRAASLVEEAAALKVAYGVHDDTPAKVEALLHKAKDIAEQRSSQPQGDGWRRQYADLLMEQAEQLLRYKEFEEAERLAMDASRLKANYGPFDSKPDGLLGKINAERKGADAIVDSAVTQASAAVRQTDTAVRQADAMPGRLEAAAQAVATAQQQSIATAQQRSAAGQRTAAASKDQVLLMLAEARAALAAGDVDGAEQLARQAEAARLPERAFGPQDDRAWKVLLEVQVARNRNMNATRAGGAVAERPFPTTQAVYDSANDPTRNTPATARSMQTVDPAEPERLPPTAAATAPLATGPAATGPAATGGEPPSAIQLFQEGEQALRDRDTPKARERFRQAYALRDQLDPVTAQRLQDHLQLLTAPQSASARAAGPKNLMDDAASHKTLLFKQLSAEVARQQVMARKTMESDPQKALEMIEGARQTVEASTIDAEPRGQLLKRVEISRAEIDKYIEQHRAQIDADAQNKDIAGGVEARRRKKLEIDDRLATMVNECNSLMEQRRYPEAEVIAKRVAEIAPNNPISKQLMWNVKFAYRNYKNQNIIDEKEQGVMDAFYGVEEAAIPFNDNNPFQFPEAGKWKQFTDRRSAKARAEKGSHRSERDLEIERKLKTPVSLSFKNKPLREALNELAKLADVNMHLDPEGLTAEGVDASTPVTFDLTREISLRSALNLILQPLKLGYVIKDEVLKITSEQLKDGDIYPVTYNVADLVIPIPNFVPNGRMGLGGALADALGQSMATGGMSGFGTSNLTSMVASQDGSGGSGMVNPAVLGQMAAGGGRGGVPINQPNGFTPGGMGGGNQADFDPLIQLITSTVNPTSWDEVGGPGSIVEFKTNLSLVISQTQEIHEQIADLLSQLRRLQDLQVTIEVRFITLNDNFFEQIGVDFNFNVENLDKSSINVNGHPTSPGATVGLTGFTGGVPAFTSNLDIPFTDNSFQLATPQFGNPTPGGVANFGIAFLSDVEAYFLVNASQGDVRSNVMQAPKVTLFNGQQAFVSDTSQTPFVISVVPVVGDFAAAQMPVIVVLSEGTFLTVQAVVSADRRFVRLTVVPFFSQIGAVQEFTFQGSNTSTNSSSAGGGKDVAGDQSGSNSSSNANSSSGITVQLPTFSFVTVTTTVSVPDGGTVLLGGVKRLSEGRNEFGVPILSKLPYINRLFKNVGIGRQTQSLMMMVTPRIIIAEEEESLLGIQTPTAGP